VYSEHVSYVNLVDARTFNERQVVRVAPAYHDEHISGIALSPDSRVCFVGTCISKTLTSRHGSYTEG